MRWVRIGLVLGGLGLLAVGVGGLAVNWKPSLLFLPLWLAGAVLLHDGVLVPTSFGVGAGLWRITGGLPSSARQCVVAGVWLAVLVTGLALPLILREGVVANPTVLPSNYLVDLLWTLAAIAAATTIMVVSRVRSGPNGRRPNK